MTDTPAPDHAARNLAEQVFAAYARLVEGPLQPQHEQVLVTRLAEAARLRIAAGENALVNAVNASLDAFEEAEPAIRGPRLAGADPATGVVRLAVD